MLLLVGWFPDPDLEAVGLGGDAKPQEVAEVEEVVPEEEEDEDKAYFEL